MKRVSSAPGLTDLAAASSAGPTVGQPFKTPAVLAAGRGGKVITVHAKSEATRMLSLFINANNSSNPRFCSIMQHNSLGNAVKTSAVLVDSPMETSLPLSPAPSADLVFAIATKGLPSTECLANIEMKDAPSLDLAMCMATPVVPDEGPGAEVRQRAAAMNAQAEMQLRLRYAEEIAARAAVRMRRILSRKRSVDDLDLHEILQELESSKPKRLSDRQASPSTGNGSPGAGKSLPPDHGPKDPSPQKQGSGKKSNVVPFHRPANVTSPRARVL